jgi:signal transduction histidine kinase
MRVVVEDDGVGFDVKLAERPREAGLGIFGMEERASLLGGTLTVDSAPGEGTRIQADLPMTEPRQI